MRVGVTDLIDIALLVEAAGGEPGDHAAREADHAQHERHRPRELLAVARLVLEQEGGKRIGALGNVRRVVVSLAQVALDRADGVIGRVGVGGEPAGESVDPAYGEASTAASEPRSLVPHRGIARARAGANPATTGGSGAAAPSPAVDPGSTGGSTVAGRPTRVVWPKRSSG